MARICIVDDEESVIKSLEVLLHSEGHQISSAMNSDDAFKLLGSEKFDLLLTDLQIKPFDGMELMVRARNLQPDLPMIVVSAYNSESAMRECFEHGCCAYLEKPFKIDDVLNAVNNALGK